MKTGLNKEPSCTGWQHFLHGGIVIGLIMLVILLAAGGVSAVPSEEWNRTFGGIGDYYARSVQQTGDGGYILAGYIDSYGTEDAWIRKTDAFGREVWNKTFRRGKSNVISSVRQTTDRGYVLTGYTGPDGDSLNTWIIKTDEDGKEQWNRTFGEKLYGWVYSTQRMVYSWAYSVQQTSDGGYILAGQMRPQRAPWNEASFDAYLIKTDADGNEQWSRRFGGTRGDVIYSVQQTADDGYILAGVTNSYRNHWGDAWLIRTDKDGNEQWNRTYYIASSFAQSARSVHETSDGGYILGGTILYSNGSGNDAWLIKTDKNGSEQWNRTFGDKGDEGASSIQQTADGGYALAGSHSAGAGAQDAWLVKTDANGNEQWNRTFGGKFNAYSIVQTADGGYILAGDAFPSGADGRDAWLIKVSRETTGTAGLIESRISSVEKAAGFGVVLAIAILLAAYTAIWKRR